MKAKTWVLGFALFCLTACPGWAQSATFEWAVVFSSNQGWDSDDFSNPDSYTMYADAGVDPATYPVYVQNIPDGEENEPLTFSASSNEYFAIYGSPVPGEVWERTYTFFVDENENGVYDDGTDTATTWELSEVKQVPLVDTLKSSGGLHPTFTWDDVDVGTMKYHLQLYEIKPDGSTGPGTGPALWTIPEPIIDDESASYSYHYTGDLFETYDELALRIQARDSLTFFENRSVYYTKSSVPLPSALWLLGSGLAALVAMRRKRRNR